jgi:hypothetical protein
LENIFLRPRPYPMQYLKDNFRWLVGLTLTSLIIILLLANLYLTYSITQKLNSSFSPIILIPDKKVKEIWLKINAIENFVRTTPLVECGDHYGRKD